MILFTYAKELKAADILHQLYAVYGVNSTRYSAFENGV